jgi:hypothetical protein
MRKALVYCEVKWKKLSRRRDMTAAGNNDVLMVYLNCWEMV